MFIRYFMTHETSKKLGAILKSVYNNLNYFTEYYGVDFGRFLESLHLISRQVRQGTRILDIACGPAILALAMKKMGHDVVGVDRYIFPSNQDSYFNTEHIEEIKKIWIKNNLEVLPLDYKDLDTKFPSDHFDLINCDAFIEHLDESPRKLFLQMRKLVKPGGFILITTPNLTSLLKRVRFLCGLSCMWDFNDYWKSEMFLGHRREFTVFELKEMCQKSGFKMVVAYTKNVYPTGKVKKIGMSSKIIRSIIRLFSKLIPDSGEVIYLLAQKE